ncbi:Large tegument protein deneddylase [Frankliniella fusca]|uniref:Large tegument protein deneddylase n=1 Tax=Frankliniella fusca TaxID=407009 RepID=A0AAE1H937_9NEOP|nr:Large tegument protein deneddylase [Frankliniella fusca]
MRVLSGTFDQSDCIRFSKYCGRQCTANAVAGACKANVVNPSLWTSQTIDECLMTGNKLFELSYELLPTTFTHLYLRPDELYSTVSFPENEITFQVAVNEVFDGTSINSIATVNSDGPTNYCLHDAILCFFHNFNSGIFTSQVESIAVMKIENQFYLFDAHKRGKNGLRDGANGTAVLVCFTDINELVIHLKALYTCCRCCSASTASCINCQFSISPLLITNVKNITDVSLNNGTETSNVSHKGLSKLEIARNAKKIKKPINFFKKSTKCLIRPTEVKYERTLDMKAKNVEQMCKRYNTDVLVKETKAKQVREKYQNDESFRESHSKKMQQKYKTNESFKISHSKKMQEKMREKMQEKYKTDESFRTNHKTNMREKYQTNKDYHDKLLTNVKNSCLTIQGTKRKSNYQSMYHASKKKISLQERFNEQKKEMPTVICTCCAQLFFKKSTVHELTLKIDKSLRISDKSSPRK